MLVALVSIAVLLAVFRAAFKSPPAAARTFMFAVGFSVLAILLLEYCSDFVLRFYATGQRDGCFLNQEH
jgi:hypothetical protein